MTTWEAVQTPDFAAANFSDTEWRVLNNGGKVFAQRTSEITVARPRPKFTPRAGNFGGGYAFARVDDGWLVSFNEGEFGAALYWFSADGQKHYKVSDHQVVDFIPTPDGLLAIEGLAHMGGTEGSLIRIVRKDGKGPWRAETAIKLPFAPYAAVVRSDGTLVIVLSNSIVEVTRELKLRTLLSSRDWMCLYPNSATLSADQQRLYIGMRQFVGEFDLAKGIMRFLIPDRRFLGQPKFK